jgi:two-component sensor histidine kinase
MLERLKQEIVERQRKEEELAASVQEKELLLKEIHHRVKNNLQLIASLLNLRMSRMERGESWDLLQNIKHKVYSMAYVHEHLYRSDALTRIEMGPYLTTLIKEDGAEAGGAAIAYSVEADGIQLSLDRAMPIGLIVSELVMNARKYAFRGRERGRIDISLRKAGEGKLDLAVCDDGVGLPPERQESGNSLGYLLVKPSPPRSAEPFPRNRRTDSQSAWEASATRNESRGFC